MKTIGFPISHKENERRIAMLPCDVASLRNPSQLCFESGYGLQCGFADSDYVQAGAHVGSRMEVLCKDIICDPKIGDAEYLNELHPGQTIFGWIHAVQNRKIADTLVHRQLTAYAWEDMFEQGRHVFWRNNEIAGEAAIMHAFQIYGEMPYNTRAALLGRGNTAMGALKILTLLGADVSVYTRATEALFQKEMGGFDVIVNAILWDTSRTDHIINKTDLAALKRGALIIDISCDKNGGIESSVPTTFREPTYVMDSIMHYAVDHTPSLFFKTASASISQQIRLYAEHLAEGTLCQTLQEAKITDGGRILDHRIIRFQKRQG